MKEWFARARQAPLLERDRRRPARTSGPSDPAPTALSPLLPPPAPGRIGLQLNACEPAWHGGAAPLGRATRKTVRYRRCPATVTGDEPPQATPLGPAMGLGRRGE